LQRSSFAVLGSIDPGRGWPSRMDLDLSTFTWFESAEIPAMWLSKKVKSLQL
jgi:hypothetical protein